MSHSLFSKSFKLGLVLTAVLCCITGRQAAAQGYHAKKALNYMNLGWQDSAFREARAGEQAGEPSSALILLECYMSEYGTPRNVTRACQIIEKWYARSYEICNAAITLYSTNDLNNYLSDGCKLFDREIRWRGYVKPNLAQSLKFAKTMIAKWPDQAYPGACVIIYCYLDNYTAGGDLKQIIIDKNLRADIVDAYLQYKFQSVGSIGEMGAVMTRIKTLPEGYYEYLIKRDDRNLLMNNSSLRAWQRIHEVWNKFLADNRIETENGKMTDAGAKTFAETYRKSDAATRSAIDYYAIAGYVDGSLLVNLPEFAETRKCWTEANLYKARYDTFAEIVQDPLCDLEYAKEKYPEQYDNYLKQKAEEERLAEERRKREEQRLAEMRKARVEGSRNNLTAGFEKLKNLKGVKFWGADIAIGSDYDTYRESWNAFEGNKNTLVNAIKNFLPLDAYEIVEEPRINEADNSCTCVCRITRSAKKKKKEVYKLTVYFTPGNKIDAARTFDMEKNAVRVDGNQ